MYSKIPTDRIWDEKHGAQIRLGVKTLSISEMLAISEQEHQRRLQKEQREIKELAEENHVSYRSELKKLGANLVVVRNVGKLWTGNFVTRKSRGVLPLVT